MKPMTDKQKVLAVHPDAYVTYNGHMMVTEVWSTPCGGSFLGQGSGRGYDSESRAWADAASKLPPAVEEQCKWCGCSLPFGMVATCFHSPNGLCESSTVQAPEEVESLPVEDKDETRNAIMADRQYIAGARFGWNCGQLDAKKSLDDAIEARQKLIWAEPKPTPSTPADLVESIAVYVESESECLMPIVVEEPKHDYGVRLLKVMATEIREKFQPGSSSINTKQTFEEWWANYQPIRTIGFADYISCARASWNAAKGSK
ncbi:MAG TPA: hypothetical protein VN517_03775 [Terriglobales bacterium]|nr:hypothetical protein [Terriglobales bacterium]